MSFYSIVLFLHITGAVGIFIGIGLEWFIVSNFKRVATTEQAQQWTNSFKVLPPTFGISGVLILLPGIYMSAEIWGMNAWVISGLALYIFLAVFGSVVVAKNVGAIREALNSEGENLSDAIRAKIKAPILTESLKMRSMLALSIIFMMTIKPDWTITIVSVGIAVAIGFMLTKITK